MLMFAAPASASVIVQDIPFSADVQDANATVFADPFNAALGTLTGVSVTVSADYMPDILVEGPVGSPSSSVLHYQFGGPGDAPVKAVGGTFPLVLNASNDLTGPAEHVGFTVVPASDLGAYIDTQPVYVGFLDMFSLPAAGTSWPTYVDNSTYSGTFEVTYTYAVAEPASLTILGSALVAMAVRRRRSRR